MRFLSVAKGKSLHEGNDNGKGHMSKLPLQQPANFVNTGEGSVSQEDSKGEARPDSDPTVNWIANDPAVNDWLSKSAANLSN